MISHKPGTLEIFEWLLSEVINIEHIKFKGKVVSYPDLPLLRGNSY